MTIIICDVDNVISDDSWRADFVRPGEADPWLRYHPYHQACCLDVAANLHLLTDPPGARVVLLTAMPEEYGGLREDWLARNRVPYSLILYRPPGDHRPSVVVKRERLLWLFEDPCWDIRDVVAAYDDRADVVEMFCELGLPGRRVAINEREPRHDKHL